MLSELLARLALLVAALLFGWYGMGFIRYDEKDRLLVNAVGLMFVGIGLIMGYSAIAL